MKKAGFSPFWGLVTLVKKLNFQAVIKSAASAASPTAWGAPRAVVRIRPVVRPTPSSHRAPSSGAPQAVGEAALAADLITA